MSKTYINGITLTNISFYKGNKNIFIRELSASEYIKHYKINQ